jgi:hypothetical protein
VYNVFLVIGDACGENVGLDARVCLREGTCLLFWAVVYCTWIDGGRGCEMAGDGMCNYYLRWLRWHPRSVTSFGESCGGKRPEVEASPAIVFMKQRSRRHVML